MVLLHAKEKSTYSIDFLMNYTVWIYLYYCNKLISFIICYLKMAKHLKKKKKSLNLWK